MVALISMVFCVDVLMLLVVTLMVYLQTHLFIVKKLLNVKKKPILIELTREILMLHILIMTETLRLLCSKFYFY